MKYCHVSQWFLCLFMLMGCSDEKKNIAEKTSQSSPASDAKAQHVLPSQSTTQVPHAQSNQQVSRSAEAKRIASEVIELLSSLQNGGDIIETIRTAWASFAFPNEINQTASQDDLRKILEASADNLITELHQPTELWISNYALRRAAIARHSLLMALFGGETSAASRYPSLISEASHRKTPTSEDLMMLKITRLALIVMESPHSIKAEDFTSWIETASAQNPACRAAVLFAFTKMKTTPEQQESFYRIYVRESNAHIAKLAVEQITKEFPPQAIMLIKAFQSSSPHASDLKPIFDQAIASLQQRTP